MQSLSLHFNVETKTGSQVIEKPFVMICRYLSEIDKESFAEISLPTVIAKSKIINSLQSSATRAQDTFVIDGHMSIFIALPQNTSKHVASDVRIISKF